MFNIYSSEIEMSLKAVVRAKNNINSHKYQHPCLGKIAVYQFFYYCLFF